MTTESQTPPEATEPAAPTDAQTDDDGLSPATRAAMASLVQDYRPEDANPPSTPEPASQPEPVDSDPEKPETAPEIGDPLESVFERAKAQEDEIRRQRDEFKAELEEAQRLRQHLDTFEADPLEGVRELLRLHLGDKASDEAIDGKLAEIHESLTGQRLGLSVNSTESKALREAIKLKREIAEIKRDKAALKKKEEEAAKAAESEKQRQAVVQRLNTQLEDMSADLPFLMAEKDPGGVLYDAAQKMLDAGHDITLQDAAIFINNQIQRQVLRYQHLLAPSQGGVQTTQSKASESPRKSTSRTLTNSAAALVSTSPPQEADYDGDDDAWTQRTLSLMRQKIQQSD